MKKLLLTWSFCLPLLTGLAQKTERTEPLFPSDEPTAECGTTPFFVAEINKAYTDYVKSKGRPKSGGTVKFIPQSTFDPALVVTCGSFRVYYEDINLHTGEGFDHPSSGPIRRNTLCAVLQYVESVFQMPASGPIDIFIDRSYTATFPPPNPNVLAQAGPYHPAGTFGFQAGYFPGNAAVHIQTGVDPDPNNYDGHIVVNFTQTYIEDHTATFANCFAYDLYSVLLHEVTHMLGFLSSVNSGPNGEAQCANATNSFTHFDDLFLFEGNVTLPASMRKLVTGSTPQINPVLAGVPGIANNNNIWTSNTGVPRSQPVYSGTLDTWLAPFQPTSACSHLNDTRMSFAAQAQTSPGYQAPYVMSPSFAAFVFKRIWTIYEIRLLLGLGYSLSGTFAASNSLGAPVNNLALLTNNQPPFRTNSSVPMTFVPHIGTNNMPEVMPVDFTIINTNTPANEVPLLNINVAGLLLADPDNDPVSVMPGTLTGIRGVSRNNDNNHDRLILNPAGTQISYTPEPGYFGRAQFAFYAWDGNEQGALRVVTIQVNSGNVYTVPPGNELIINPGFEDGSEVRQVSGHPNFHYSAYERVKEGAILASNHYAGGHPYGYVSNGAWSNNGGIIINDALRNCNGQTSSPPYGMNANCVNPSLPNLWFLPSTSITSNDRYAALSGTLNMSSLINPMQPCSTYTFSFEVNTSHFLAAGQSTQINLEIQNDIPTATSTPVVLQSIPVTINASNGWQTITTTFTYCGGQAASFININAPFGSAYNKMAIDNLSLRQVLSVPALGVSASASFSSVCAGTPVTLTASATNINCTPTYTWQPGNLSGASVSVTPNSPTTYTVTVNDCRNVPATSTVSVNINSPGTLTASASPASVVSGTSSTLTASGGTNYTWQPGNLSGASVSVSPATTTTYTVTSIAPNCPSVTLTATVTVTVLPPCSGNCSTVLPATISTNSSFSGQVCVLQNVTVTSGATLTLDGANCPVFGGGGGVRITVQNGAVLYILNNSQLYSCNNDMWQGIIVQAGGTVKVSGNSMIEDALIAIESTGGGMVGCSEARFNKNYQDIVLQPFGGNHSALIMQTSFTSISTPATSGAPATLKAPHTGELPDAAVIVDQVGLAMLGTNSGGAALLNSVSNHRNGFRIRQSNVIVDNTLFDNIRAVTGAACGNIPCTGIAIDDIGTGKLHVINSRFNNCDDGIVTSANVYAEIRNNRFENIRPSQQGILSYAVFIAQNSNTMGAYVSNNSFRNCQSGVAVTDFRYGNYNIESNAFTDFAGGIGVEMRNNLKSTVNIKNNSFFNPNGQASRGRNGILLLNASAENGLVTVERNQLTNCASGIRAFQIRKLKVSRNAVSFVFPTNPGAPGNDMGIWFDRCAASSVTLNTVQRTGGPQLIPASFNSFLTGIRVDNFCNGSLFSENSLRSMATGMAITGNNKPLRIYCNRFENNRIGLQLNQADIGNQGSPATPTSPAIVHGNQWVMLLGATGIQNNGSPAPVFYSVSNQLPNWPAAQISPAGGATVIVAAQGTSGCLTASGTSQLVAIALRETEKQMNSGSLSKTEARILLDVMYPLAFEARKDPSDTLAARLYKAWTETNTAKFYSVRLRLIDGAAAEARRELESIRTAGTIDENWKLLFNALAEAVLKKQPPPTDILRKLAGQPAAEGGGAVVEARILLGTDPQDKTQGPSR